VLLCLAPATVKAQPRAVRLLAASPTGVRLLVDVPEAQLEPVPSPGQGLQLELPGYDRGGGPGESRLPERVLCVAVPPQGTVRVTASVAATDVREGILLANPSVAGRGEGMIGGATPGWALATGERGAGGRATGPPPSVARLIGLSWMRDQRVARIAVRPAEYDAADRRLTIHHRVEVEVRWEGGTEESRPVAPPDPFESVYRAVLVNYEQGKAWRGAERPARVAPVASRAAAPRMASVVPDTSLYAGRRWVKIAIPTTGFYRVEFGQVRNSELFADSLNTPLDSLRLFTWPGLPVLPEDSYCDSCGLREVAIQFVEDGDGKFNKNQEYFYFFALGPSDWANFYDPSQPETTSIDHPYETRNYYYLTIATTEDPMPDSSLRIASRSRALLDTTVAVTPLSFPERLHHEADNEYWPSASPITGLEDDGSYQRSTLFWEKWFWTSLNRGQTFAPEAAAPGIDPSQPARLRLRLWGLPPFPELPAVPTPKSPGVFDHYVDVRLGSLSFPRRGWNGNGADVSAGLQSAQTFDTTFTGLAESGARLEMTVVDYIDRDPRLAPLRVDRVGVAWFDLFYQRRFEPVGNQLEFEAPPTTGDDIYRIGPFTVGPDSMPRVFDVTNPLEPIEITVLPPGYDQLGPGAWRLRFRPVEAGAGEVRRYRIVTDWPDASRIVKLPNSEVFDAPSSSLENLRDLTHRADYLIIYLDGLQFAAQELLAWRRDHLPLASDPPYEAVSVPLSAVYDQFSGGRTDPGAVRNFLHAAFHWGKVPTFVTLLGDATSDFKNFKGGAPVGFSPGLLPSYEGGFDLNFLVLRQFATDDWLLNVDNPTQVIPDFQGGRIPARDAAGALAYVRKLVAYERGAPLGDWRNRVMLIADDDKAGADPDPLAWLHVEQTAALDRDALPAHIDRGYVYLHRYPDGPNDTKPAARNDILNEVNQGVVLFNFIGHGSPFKIADESVLLDTDAEGMVNATRPSVFVAASCDVGRYNDPTVQSLGERLILNPNGGCIGVISATELALTNINASLNQALFHQVFEREPASGQYFNTLSTALLAAKTGGTNNQKYQLMGDAATRLLLPRLFVEVALEDSFGNAVGQAIRGRRLTIRGQVVERPGGAPIPLDGSASLLIEDSAPVDTLPDCAFGVCKTYPFRAAPMFRGDVRLSGGRFEGRFVVPMDGVAGPRARARAYVQGAPADSDGAGSLPFEVAVGTPPADDREGPHITLSFPGNARSVRPTAVLRVDLFDPNGILITGHKPQNGIVVTTDGSSRQRQEITSSFRYAADSYQSGTATYQLPGLSSGPHRIVVSAADNLAFGIAAAEHRSTAVIDFEVSDNPGLKVERALLFPNPTASRGPGAGGSFVVDAPGDSVNVLLRIYTVSGRLVRTLEALGGLGQVQIPWDGRDDEGGVLANGVYLFRVHVNPRAPNGTSSDRQKAHAEGRFVIVNR
jgi:hypothetical protein